MRKASNDGVADVLFWNYLPTGKLSMTFPRTTADALTNVGDQDYNPQFKYGFGLGYQAGKR